MNAKVEILECTLRDASYPVRFQFTAEDTAVIARGLEDAGFRSIEIGHGLGLGASETSAGRAAASDEEYLDAVSAVLSHAAFGVFVIPGIAGLEHLDLAARHGADFVRIGTDVTRTESAEGFIKRAKDLGLSVSANLMKSYAVPVSELVRRSERVAAWGADVISVVDSAGGMFPEQVRACVDALRANIGARVGFHGHNNLQLAVANALAAVEAGATVVDATLRGLGRSSGNAQTEALALALDRLGYDTGVDFMKTMELSDKVIAPIARGRGVDSLELICGYAQFHSSFLDLAVEVAAEAGIDVRQLVIELAREDKIAVSADQARRLAAKLAAEGRHRAAAAPKRLVMPVIEPRPRPDYVAQARTVADEIFTLAAKTGRRSAFTIARRPVPDGSPPRFPFIRADETMILGNAEVETVEQAAAIGAAIDGRVDTILIDRDRPMGRDASRFIAAAVKASLVLEYGDLEAQVIAAESVVAQLLPNAGDHRIGICGLDEFGLRMAQSLTRRHAIFIFDADPVRTIRVANFLAEWRRLAGLDGAPVAALDPGQHRVNLLIGASERQPVVTAAMVAALEAGGAVIDAGGGSMTDDAITACRRRGIAVVRLDMRAGVFAQAAAALATRELLGEVMGARTIDGISVVAGGSIGARGAVVLDRISEPSRIVGVADGFGRVLEQDGPEFAEAVGRVRRELLQRRLPRP